MKTMCQALQVSRSGYYAWFRRKPSARDQQNQLLLEKIRLAYEGSRKAYGSPRIYQALRREGAVCGRNRVARLMREAGLKAQRQYYYKRNTPTVHGRLEASNLVNQEFSVSQPNRIWASDITHFRTGAGWLYLSVVMDLYSRRILGWSMKTEIREDLVVDALEMAVQTRNRIVPVIHHSDQGSQYASRAFMKRLKEYNIKCSMSRKGNCYDNAVVESFFKSLKAELTKSNRFKTKEDAHYKLFEYIEVFYNRQRLHSSLGYSSPVEFELRNTVN